MLGAACTIAVLTLAWRWRITDIEVRGTMRTPPAAIRDATFDALQGSRWGILPNTSMLGAPLRRIRTDLRERFVFERIESNRTWRGMLILTVHEYPATALVLWGEGSTAALVNASGIYLGMSTAEKGASPLPRVLIPPPASPLGIGDALIASNELQIIVAVWSDLARAGGLWDPQRVSRSFDPPATVDFATAGGTTVRITTLESLDVQRSKLRTVIARRSADSQGHPPRVLDVRYGDRAYLQE